MTVHYYWIGAVPAMVFLGIVMMPFYYGSKVRSVPEYLRRGSTARPTCSTRSPSRVAQVLIAGVNLYALALVIQALLGWPLLARRSSCRRAVRAGLHHRSAGCPAAIYNEVLQFFVILAGLVPLSIIGLVKVGGWSGLTDKVRDAKLGEAGLHAWAGTGSARDNPLGDWIGIVFGLGFVLSFGYWTTNFAEVQRALSAKN